MFLHVSYVRNHGGSYQVNIIRSYAKHEKWCRVGCLLYGSYLKVRDLLSLYEVFTIITVVTG